ncbi:MAG TPA: hypothetical protein VFN09_03720 [Rhodanobacteraceae bacterium]|nr:hypothetical protein [Rhodanobacteraceae bacterium]
MNAPPITVATLGLPQVAESLVKSLLNVLDGRTSANWRHVEGFDADVVLCAPDSPFGALARRKEREHGRPLCIAVAAPGEAVREWTRVLHQPLRMHQFLDVLETLSSEIQSGQSGAAPKPPVESAAHHAHEAAPRNTLVAELRGLYQAVDTTERSYLIKAGGVSMAIDLPQGRCHVKSGFTTDTFERLMAVRGEVDVQPLPPGNQRDQLVGEPWIWLETLLWRLGLLGRAETDLGSDPDASTFGLRCWPDFGKIPSNPVHIKLTALLSKRELGIEAAAAMLNVASHDVRAFLRACACCGLLKVTALQRVVVAVPPQRKTGFGVFDFLRSALGMKA